MDIWGLYTLLKIIHYYMDLQSRLLLVWLADGREEELSGWQDSPHVHMPLIEACTQDFLSHLS